MIASFGAPLSESTNCTSCLASPSGYLPFGPGGVGGQAFYVGGDCVEAGSGQMASLTHPAAQHLADAVCPSDGVPVAYQHAAHRGT